MDPYRNQLLSGIPFKQVKNFREQHKLDTEDPPQWRKETTLESNIKQLTNM